MQQERRTYMLGYIGGRWAEKRKRLQREACEWWMSKNHEVIVLDPTFTEEEFYEFMPRTVNRIGMSDFSHICRARNFALQHAIKSHTDYDSFHNKLIVLADNDGGLRDMSDYEVSTDELIDAVYSTDCDIVQPKQPFGFIKQFFDDDKSGMAKTHLCLTNQNTFKGTVLFVRAGIDVQYDEWFDQPYETHALTPGEDFDFCVRAKMNGYKVRFAENLVQYEYGSSSNSTWCPDSNRKLEVKPWVVRNNMQNISAWNKKYNTKYGRKEYIKLKSTVDLFENMFD